MNLKHQLIVISLTALLAASVQAADKKHGSFAAPQKIEPSAGSIWKEHRSGMEFVWIPGGCFRMGWNEGKKDEIPVHKVCVKGFYLGKYEVTQAQYQKINGNNPSAFPGADRPVEKASFYDIKSAIDEFNVQTNGQFRLPSEAEWEYACRAGGDHGEYCGIGGLDKLAWYNDNSGSQTHPVGQKRPNAWGLYDMNGNVGEWVRDCSHNSYDGAPTDGSAWLGENGGDCGTHVMRGGAWDDDAHGARATNRYGVAPAKRFSNSGFRLVRTLQ